MGYPRGIGTAIAYRSAARTASPTPVELPTESARGAAVVVDVTAINLTPSVTFHIETQDPASGKWIALLSSAAIAAVGTTRLVVYPGIAPAANAKADDVLGARVRIRPVHADADSITYSVGVEFLV